MAVGGFDTVSFSIVYRHLWKSLQLTRRALLTSFSFFPQDSKKFQYFSNKSSSHRNGHRGTTSRAGKYSFMFTFHTNLLFKPYRTKIISFYILKINIFSLNYSPYCCTTNSGYNWGLLCRFPYRNAIFFNCFYL